MKKVRNIIFVVGILMSLAATSRADVIILKSGNSLQVENLEISKKWAYYNEPGASSDDIKRISIDDVFAYKVGDGNMVTVEAAQSDKATANESAQQPAGQQAPEPSYSHVPVPAADNEAIIAAYNSSTDIEYKGKKPNPNKFTDRFISIWGIEENSVISDENVEIGFVEVVTDEKTPRVVGHYISVRNKSPRAIYIDLASCYRLMNGGYSAPYFTNSIYKETQSGSSGTSVNAGAVAGALGIGGAVGRLAGGISVGSSKGQAAGIETVEQQILTLPAGASVTLPGPKVSDGTEIIECYEPIYYCSNVNKMNSGSGMVLSRAKGPAETIALRTIREDSNAQRVSDDRNATGESLNIREWMLTEYTPATTPKRIGRVITYATTPDFSDYVSLPVNLYMRGAFGISGNANDDYFFNPSKFSGITDPSKFITGYGLVSKKK